MWLVTKIIVNRLKPLMSKLVSPAQTSFVPGRHMTENILIAQEILHSFHTKRGKGGYMAIKVDLEKAYDRLSWKYIRSSLLDAGLPLSFIELIMRCVESTSMSVIWNGK